jgi:hypothetical protein
MSEMTPMEYAVTNAIMAYHKTAVEPLILKVNALEQQANRDGEAIDGILKILMGKRLHD